MEDCRLGRGEAEACPERGRVCWDLDLGEAEAWPGQARGLVCWDLEPGEAHPPFLEAPQAALAGAENIQS